jgi:hypothetical protein
VSAESTQIYFHGAVPDNCGKEQKIFVDFSTKNGGRVSFVQKFTLPFFLLLRYGFGEMCFLLDCGAKEVARRLGWQKELSAAGGHCPERDT